MDKYLLEILKDSNTIIIPGLGALTITNKDTGETMFMPYLQHDDGKLAAFIAQNDGIDEADAKNMVAKYVREIKAELDKGESYSMIELGTFVKKDDGDIEFSGWANSDVNEEESPTAPVAAPIVEETVNADEPIVEDTPEPEPELIPEPTIEEEPIDSTPEPVVEPEVIPDPVAESEPVIENEPEANAEPEPEREPEIIHDPRLVPEASEEQEPEPEIVHDPRIIPEATNEPEPIETEPIEAEVPAEEIEIRETIVEAFNSTEEIDEIIPEKTTLEPSALLDDIAPTAAVAMDSDMESGVEGESEEEPEEEEKKKKAGVGFWITIIIVALGIIAGGAYIGRNYNELKQHVPFLADKDEEADKNSLKDEISNVIKEDKYTANSEAEVGSDENSDGSEEELVDEGQEEGNLNDQGSSETAEIIPQPEPEIRTPEVTPPTPVNVTMSSSGPFKVIAGAFSSEANANRLAAEYKAKGMKSEVFMKGELFAVSMQSYATTEEANANLPKLQSMAPGAWIYYKR